MKACIDIFSGFLGAGKTTLIKKLIKEEFYKEKVVIIENEFGEIGIDGSFLRKSNIEIKEINSGCICCTVSGDFNKAIEEVVKSYNPERIIIEPSGVAKLSEVLSACKSDKIKNVAETNMVITVADALKFHMYLSNFSEFYKNQIINAGIVILSRTQNLSSDNISKVTEKIKTLNDSAHIVTTPWDKLKGSQILEVSKEALSSSLLKHINLIRKPINSPSMLKTSTSNLTKETFHTYGFETPRIFSRDKLNSILTEIKNNSIYGNILRAKGIVQISDNDWIEFDYVPGEKEFRASIPDCIGRICIIGNDLNKQNLGKLFLEENRGMNSCS